MTLINPSSVVATVHVSWQIYEKLSRLVLGCKNLREMDSRSSTSVWSKSWHFQLNSELKMRADLTALTVHIMFLTAWWCHAPPSASKSQRNGLSNSCRNSFIQSHTWLSQRKWSPSSCIQTWFLLLLYRCAWGKLFFLLNPNLIWFVLFSCASYFDLMS